MMYCRKCHYPLWDLPEPRCPECGTQYDPEDPGTFLLEQPSRFDQLAPKVFIILASISAVLALLALIVLVLVRHLGSR